MLEFSDYEKQMKVPFVIYADFETINVKLYNPERNPDQSNTTQTALLQPISFAYLVCCQNPKYSSSVKCFREVNSAKKLLESLLQEQDEILDLLKSTQPLLMTKDDHQKFDTATHCCLCDKAFPDADVKVRHHQHFSFEGKFIQPHSNFIGAAHNKCNILAKDCKFIPVIFHYLKKFDSHLIMQGLDSSRQSNIKCIPQTLEKYISFSIGSLRFIDSFQFLPSSFETLVDSLVKSDDTSFHFNKKAFPEEELLKLILRKGVYPYDYMDSEDRFAETQLPRKEEFYS